MSLSSGAQERANLNWGTSPLLDGMGNPMRSTGPLLVDQANPGYGNGSGGGGNGGEVVPLWKTDIARDVQIAKWGLGVLFLGFCSIFMFFNGEQKDIRKDISDVKASVAGQTVAVASLTTTVDRIEDKIDRPASRQPKGLHNKTGASEK